MAQLGESLISGFQAGQKFRAGQLAKTQQQREMERFLDRSNLESTVRGALQFRTIADPTQQDAFLRDRIAEIESRGGDPRDTVELLNTPYEKRQGVVDNLINIGERFKIIGRDPATGVVKFGQPRAGITPTGEQAFFQTSPTGEVRRVEGFAPIPKEGETIETLPGGGVRITRGKGGKSKRYTEGQSKAGGFAFRLNTAIPILTELENKVGFSPEALAGQVAENIPLLGNLIIGEDRQVYNQAKENFVTAVLRKESGAVISDSEFKREDRKYFPQAGDGPRVIANKRKARSDQLKILKAESAGMFDEINKQHLSTVVIPDHPTLGDVTEAEIREAMKNKNMTRQQVLGRLQGKPNLQPGLKPINIK